MSKARDEKRSRFVQSPIDPRYCFLQVRHPFFDLHSSPCPVLDRFDFRAGV